MCPRRGATTTGTGHPLFHHAQPLVTKSAQFSARGGRSGCKEKRKGPDRRCCIIARPRAGVRRPDRQGDRHVPITGHSQRSRPDHEICIQTTTNPFADPWVPKP
ncbi:hypothetical protein U1Q18_005647 [Sarracenia purpurea var. burkii]